MCSISSEYLETCIVHLYFKNGYNYFGYFGVGLFFLSVEASHKHFNLCQAQRTRMTLK